MTPVSLKAALLRGWLPPRSREAHKGGFGHVLVAAGSRGMMGAGRLCALGALRSGAGLVTWAVPESLQAAAEGPWEAMTVPLPDEDGAFRPAAAAFLLDFIGKKGITAVALGPGLSRRAAKFALALLEESPVPVVADADALNALAEAARVPRRRAPWVLTPHPGEAARLLGADAGSVQEDRPGSARALAERFGATAVLKGAGTLIAGADALYKNGTGNPAMASGGMGDVLTGVIAGLVGQVRAATPAQAALRAAALGVFLHGSAGDKAARELGPAGVLASDVAARLPAALKDFF